MDPQGQSGQVVGNIVSEWTQLFGLALLFRPSRASTRPVNSCFRLRYLVAYIARQAAAVY
jgi:hypothetical protein